jgi:hypothetical protein
LDEVAPDVWERLPKALAALLKGLDVAPLPWLVSEFPPFVLGILKGKELVPALDCTESAYSSLDTFERNISDIPHEGLGTETRCLYFEVLNDFIPNLDRWHGIPDIEEWGGRRAGELKRMFGQALGETWRNPSSENAHLFRRNLLAPIEHFVEAFALYYFGTLVNIVTFLARNPEPNSRTWLFEKLRQSKLGPPFVNWLESKTAGGRTVLDELILSPLTNRRLPEEPRVPSPAGTKSEASDHNRQPYHNTPTLDVEVVKNSFETDNKGKVDTANLVGKDAEAREILLTQKREQDEIQEVFESAELSSLKKETLVAGTKIYGFSTMGRGKESTSAYWLTEKDYNEVKALFALPPSTAKNREAVKQYLALPCYNRVTSVCEATISGKHTAIRSRIAPAKELIAYSDGTTGWTTGNYTKTMTGGGWQLTPNPKYVTNIHETAI